MPQQTWRLRAVLWLFWLCFGLFHNLHLVILWFVSNRCCGCRRYVCLQAVGSNQFLQRRMLQHWLSLALVVALGAACRELRAVRCEGGEDMSRRCLFNAQAGTYMIFYVLHFVAVAWALLQWLADGPAIWGWAEQMCCGVSLAPFGVHGTTRLALRICYGNRSAHLYDRRQATVPTRCASASAMEVATAFGVAIVTLVSVTLVSRAP